MKDFKYIIKRIIIGVGIAFLLMLIRGNFITKVQAKTTITGGLAIATPKDTTLENYDDIFYTNIDYDSSLSYRDLTGLHYNFLLNYNDSYSYTQSLPDLNTSVNLPGNSHGSSINRFAINFLQGSNHLDFDTDYSIALKFTKDFHIDWEGLSTDESLYSFTLYGKNENDSNYTLLNDSFVVIDSVGFYTYQQNNDPTNNGVFIINFHLSSDDYTYSFSNITLTSLIFSRYSTSQPNWSSNRTFYPSILNNTSNNSYTFINKQLYFIKGKMLPYGEWCNDDTIHFGCGVTGDNPFSDSSGMDVVHDTDIEVFDELPTCDPLDIPCHINRVVKTIQDLFVRFGNFFREFIQNIKESIISLFVPSSSYMTSFVTSLQEDLEEQLGFLIYPFELIVNILNRFLTLTRSSVISFSGFNYPGTSQQIIPSFSYDFDDLLSTGNFATLYNYYFILINGIISFAFINLCIKKFNSFIH